MVLWAATRPSDASSRRALSRWPLIPQMVCTIPDLYVTQEVRDLVLLCHVKTLSDKKADVKRLVHLGTLGTYRRNVRSLHNKNVRWNLRKLKPKSFY